MFPRTKQYLSMMQRNISENYEDVDIVGGGSEDTDVTESNYDVCWESEDDVYIPSKKKDLKNISREAHNEIKTFTHQCLKHAKSSIEIDNIHITLTNMLLLFIVKLLFCIKKKRLNVLDPLFKLNQFKWLSTGVEQTQISHFYIISFLISVNISLHMLL